MAQNHDYKLGKTKTERLKWEKRRGLKEEVGAIADGIYRESRCLGFSPSGKQVQNGESVGDEVVCFVESGHHTSNGNNVGG